MVLTFYDRPKRPGMRKDLGDRWSAGAPPAPMQPGGFAPPPVPRYANGTGQPPIPTVDDLPQPVPPPSWTSGVTGSQKPMGGGPSSPVFTPALSWETPMAGPVEPLMQDGKVLITDPSSGLQHWVEPGSAGAQVISDRAGVWQSQQPDLNAPRLTGALYENGTPGGFNPWTFNAAMDEQKRRNDISNATAQGYTEKGFVYINGKPVSWNNFSRGYDDDGNILPASARTAGRFENGADAMLINGLDNRGQNLGTGQGGFLLGTPQYPDASGESQLRWGTLGKSALDQYLGTEFYPNPFAGSSPAGPGNGTAENPYATAYTGNIGGGIFPLPSYEEGLAAARKTGDPTGLIQAMQAAGGEWPSGDTGSRVSWDTPGQTALGTGSTASGTIYAGDVSKYSGIPDAQFEAIEPGTAEHITIGGAGPFEVTEDMWRKGLVIVDEDGQALDVGTIVDPSKTPSVIVYRLTPEEMIENGLGMPRAMGNAPPQSAPVGFAGDVPREAPVGFVGDVAAPAADQGSGSVDAFLAALSGQESGDDYEVVNSDSGAGGKYQFMPETWASVAPLAGLPSNAPMTPQNQDAVARAYVASLYEQYGNWEDVAAIWYSGQPFNEATADRPQNGYPTIREYVASVMARMSGRMNTGGYTTAPVFMAGDARAQNPAAGGARPEMIYNPTRAPIMVKSHEQTRGMPGMPRFADGTGGWGGGWTPPTGIDPIWGWTPPTWPAPAAPPAPDAPPAPMPGSQSPPTAPAPRSWDPPERPVGPQTGQLPPSQDPAEDRPPTGQVPPSQDPAAPPSYTPPAPFSLNLGNLANITTGPGGLGGFGAFGTRERMAPGFGGWDTSPSSGGLLGGMFGGMFGGNDFWDYQEWVKEHPGQTYEQYKAWKASNAAPPAGTGYGNAFGNFSTDPNHATFWLQAPDQQMALFEAMAKSMGWDPAVPGSGPYTPQDLYVLYKRRQLQGVESANGATGY